MRTALWLGLGAFMLVPAETRCQTAADTTLKVSFGGFIDGYYAYDVGRPPTLDRSFFSGAPFTTQPARANEFNVNLTYIEANISGNRVHGRLALQAGTSVQANYAAEPTLGTVSGPSLSRLIQEGYAGYQVSRTVWIDAGIFFSNAGMEGWISKDNPTYSRSLVADYSPYYSSGVRGIWQATPQLAVRLDVVNGWQNISETNTDKGVGVRFDYVPSAPLTVSYYNFFNTETGNRVRVFNGVGAKLSATQTTLLGEFDYGTLGAGAAGGGSATWWGFTAVAKQQVAAKMALVGRIERYSDPEQVNIVTGLSEPFVGNSASMGVDVTPQAHVMWRTEVRGFFAEQLIFPNDGKGPRKNDGFVVTSLSLAF
jgi:putative OmpL-like beta-barrel porin-2